MSRNQGTVRLTDNNVDILNAIRNSASTEYQSRIPAATQANISETMKSLTEYRPMWNQFCDALINRIGSVVVRDISWNNKLAEFKRQKLEYGDTIEEIAVGLVKSRLYSADRDYMEKELFGKHSVDVKSIFHTINRQEYYPITVNDMQLRRAFLEDGGISNFITALMGTTLTSDNLDEFNLMCSLFKETEINNGFHHVKLPNLNSLTATKEDSESFLKAVRALSMKLEYPSTLYNAAKMPVFARPEDMVLFATPEVIANIDVGALAAAFNIDRAQVPQRVINIPEEKFGMDGTLGVLTTKDFFVIADTVLENTSQYNPVSLGTNYYLHHQEIISASRFVPAILLNTVKDDSAAIVIGPKAPTVGTITVKSPVDGSTVAKVKLGERAIIEATLTPASGDDLTGWEIGIDYSITGQKSTRTTITNEGVLTIGDDETAATLTAKALITYRPKDALGTAPSEKTVTVTVDIPVVTP